MHFDLVLVGDVDESAKMAILSGQAYGRSLSEPYPSSVTQLPLATTSEEIDIPISGSGPKSLAIDPPQARHETYLLPVMGTDSITPHTYDAKDGVAERQMVIRSNATTVRRCDNCVLATSGCPGYKVGHLCAYIPVEIRSKD